MRIISGHFRGKAFLSPKNNSIRPTSGKSREMIFNTLNSIFIKKSIDYSDLITLDCCCGTGALGIESISRGTEKIFFLDKSKEAISLTKKNFTNLTIKTNIKVQFLNIDIKEISKGHKEVGLFFIDPPYKKNIANLCLSILANSNWLKKGAIGIVEIDASQKIIEDKDFQILKRKKIGGSMFFFLEKV